MNTPDPETLRTRASLVAGLQAGESARWQEFVELYTPLIRRFALKAGCTEVEADEALQETCIALSKHLHEFNYDPRVCRFKTWLLNQSAWRVKDQLKKRRRQEAWIERGGEAGKPDASRHPGEPPRTATIERLPDRDDGELGRLWETEWREALMAAALRKLRDQFSDRQFQMFDLNVLKAWPAGEVARSLGVSLASVYLAKHRMSAALRKEVARLEREWERSGE